jgi:biotin carboxyl carrier protein
MPSASAAPTCASTAWRGRAATSSSAAPARCGTPIGHAGVSRPSALAAAFLRSDSLLPGQRRGTAGVSRDFPHGRARLADRREVFRLRDYRRFLAQNAAGIAPTRRASRAAFEAERRRWEATGQIGYCSGSAAAHDEGAEEEPAGGVRRGRESGVRQRLEDRIVASGQSVKAGDTLVLVESMKMELPVTAPVDGVIASCAAPRDAPCWSRKLW